jgi:hypothetical protein
MVEEVVNSTPAAPVVETVVAPVVETPVVTPVTETVVAEAPKVETVVTPESTKVAETVLAQEIDKTAPKPVEPEKKEEPKAVETAEVKVDEKAQSEEPAPAPVYDPFKLPENTQLDEAKVKEFTNLLSKLEIEGKTPHDLVQKFGQEAVDFHINEIKRTINDVEKFYQTSWDKQKTDWKDDFLKDPNIGGNRFQTTVDSAINFIRTHGGTPEEQTEFRNLMETSGLGNHKAVIRLLANADKAMSEGKPLAATAPVVQQAKSKTETLYGKSR